MPTISADHTKASRFLIPISFPPIRPAALVLAALAAWSAAWPSFAEVLRVTVTDLRCERGNVHIALYATPEFFPKSDGMMADAVLPARYGGVTATFPGLAPGMYALAAYHDENGNGEFDRILFGIPLEGFAFSNGATPFFGPPEFSDAAIELTGPVTDVTIPITY